MRGLTGTAGATWSRGSSAGSLISCLPRGRAWFEHTLPDRLTLGRPDEMAIVFERRVSRRTPRRFSDQGLQRRYGAAIQIHDRAANVKQYLREASRTATTVNDTREFGIGRLLTQNTGTR